MEICKDEYLAMNAVVLNGLFTDNIALQVKFGRFLTNIST